MSPTLLDLPRELRDVIYDYLGSGHPTSGSPLPLVTLPSGTRRFTQGLHALLRVNRILRDEALDRIKDCETYLVSQRYRAFAGLHNMIPFKSASVPAQARRLYLRIYIAVPERIAKPIAQATRLAWAGPLANRLADMGSGEPMMSRGALQAECPEHFVILTSMLRACLPLEDLVLELLVKRQESLFGAGCESTENHGWLADDLEGQCIKEIEQIFRELPSMRRYAILENGGTRFVRRNARQPWTRQCLIPQCIDTCHCHEPFNKTCVEDSEDLLTGLIPTAREEWLSLTR